MHAIDRRLSAPAPTAAYAVAVPTTGWTGTGPFVTTLDVPALTATDKTVIDLDLSAMPYANLGAVQSAYSLIYRADSVAGGLTLYATAVPATAFNLNVVVL